MFNRFITLVLGCLLVTTCVANGAQRHGRWVVVKHYVGPTCHCGRHPCGSHWMEGGTPHKCVPAGTNLNPKRKKRR